MNQLNPIAQAVQSQGRGGDTQLVHMTPREVAGLQALAMAHGGSLSINPNTGLPEAGFLSDILPAVAGFALGPAGFGVMSSLGAGLAVGGLTALTSGDLGKGVMAGLGAWGGSSLGEGILGAGQAAVGGQAAANATTAAAAQGKAGIGAAANAAREAAIQEATKSQILQEGAKSALSNPAAFADTMGGFGKTAMALGAAATPAMLSAQTTTKMPEAKRTPVTVAQLEYRKQVARPRRDPNDTSEQQWFTGPGYVKTGETTYAAEGGVMGYAQGGAPITGGKRAILSPEEYLNQYFSPVQTATPMPGAKKAEGGIVSLADGGLADYAPYRTGYKPMTPEEFAKMYFGQQATPTGLPGGISGYEGREPYKATPTSPVSSTPGTGGQSGILTDENGKKYRLEFDSATGTYRKIYEAETPVAATPGAGGGAGIAGISSSGGGGGGDGVGGRNAYQEMEDKLYAEYKSFGYDDQAARTAAARDTLAKQYASNQKLADVLKGITNFSILGTLAKAVTGSDPSKREGPPAPIEKIDINTGKKTDVPPAGSSSPTGPIGLEGIGYVPSGDGGFSYPGMPSIDVTGITAYPTEGPAPAPADLIDFGGAGPTITSNTPYDSGGGGDSGNTGTTSGTDSYGSTDYGGLSGGAAYGWANGGLLSLAAGGMAKGGFVVPADVVSALGNGSTDAGLRVLNQKLAATPIKGNGDGLSDSIPTTIDGKQPARVADGEAYINPKTVAKIGGGDMRKGAKKLYAMMDNIRKAAHGKTSQQRKVNPAKVVKA